MEPVTLSREVLDWAAEKAGETLHSFAENVAKRENVRKQIIEGSLTLSQVEKLAKKARIPFGYLFLDEPPELRRSEIPDLRQVQDFVPLSNDFYEVLDDVLAKQQWFVEYLTEAGAAKLSFVGRFSDRPRRNTADVIAQDIRRELGLSDDDRRHSPNAEAYFSTLSAKVERIGVLVFKNSVVKSNTHRPLSEKEFRGFAIAHRLVPVVFVNGRDAEVAAVFTLMHELAHIWLGVDGVSDIAPRPDKPVERLCNQIAASLLVPNDIFMERWQGPADVEKLAKYFRVSHLVIARRALDNKLIDQTFYDEIASNSQRPKTKGRPSALLTIPVRNSKRFTRTIVASAMSGQTLLRDAASLLNVKPDTVVSLGRGRVENG